MLCCDGMCRLLTCEMTGATVSVVETVDPSLRQYLGRKGTVVGESMNCFHVAYEVVKTDKGNRMRRACSS